jgi:hypothetical protein
MNELKKCPFCGGEAGIIENVKGDCNILYRAKQVKCMGCGIGTDERICDGYYGLYCTDEEISEAWNTRKPVERILERLEEENMNRVDMACMTMDVFVDGQVSGLERAIEIIEEEVG